LGFKDASIQLYDPAKAEKLQITTANFRHDFQAILFLK